MTLEPLYHQHPDKSITHLEWHGLYVLKFNKSHMAFEDANPTFYKSGYYPDHFNAEISSATEAFRDTHKHVKKALYLSIGKEITTLERLYEELGWLTKPKLKGQALKDAKVRVGQREYQRDKLGDAFVDPALASKAKRLANAELAKSNPDDAKLDAIIEGLVSDHGADLSDAQRITLKDQIIRPRLEKFNALDKVEASIAASKNKAACLLWLQIKHNHLLGDEFVLGQKVVVEYASVTAKDVSAVRDHLVALGAIQKLQDGKRGSATKRASIYKRLV